MSQTCDKVNKFSSRGIINKTGVSCHLSSSLQLIYNAIDEQTCDRLVRVSQIIPTLPSSSSNSVVNASEFLVQFGTLMQAMNEDATEEIMNTCDFSSVSNTKKNTEGKAIDPSSFYRTLSPFIDSNDVGDAMTSLSTILQILRKSVQEFLPSSPQKNLDSNDKIDLLDKGVVCGDVNEVAGEDNNGNDNLRELIRDLKNRLEETFWSGTMVHTVSACKVEMIRRQHIESNTVSTLKEGKNIASETPVVTHDDPNTSQFKKLKRIRTKPSQERPLPCPFPLPVQGYTNLVQALESVVLKPQIIDGYSWDNVVDYVEEEESVGEEQVNNVNGSEVKINADCTRGNDIYSMPQTEVEVSKISLSSGEKSNMADAKTSQQKSNQKAEITNYIVSAISSKSSSSTSSDSSSDDSSYTSSSSDSTLSSSSSSSSDESEEEDYWKTNKHTQLTQKNPKVLIFHLKRFDYRKGKICKILTKLEIPPKIDISSYCQVNKKKGEPPTNAVKSSERRIENRCSTEVDKSCPFCCQYLLHGAIVHMDYADQNEDKCHRVEQDHGHYITYALKKNQPVNSDEEEERQIWIKIDDEKISPFITSSNCANKSSDVPVGNRRNERHTSESFHSSDQYPVIPKENFLNVLGGGNAINKPASSYKDRCARAEASGTHTFVITKRILDQQQNLLPFVMISSRNTIDETIKKNGLKAKKKKVGKYELGKTLGEGTFGKVKYAIHTVTGKEVAIKILDKDKIRRENLGLQIKREVSIMKQIGSYESGEKNPYVVQLYEVLASKNKIYLILELITGGELFEKIVKETRFTELKARYYLRQLVTGVELCHQLGICHRDLKPENLLLDSKDNLKISDFGLSALYNGDCEGPVMTEMMSCRASLLHTACGTPNYVAPEVLKKGGYDGRAADIWSIGVILYVLVTGTLPFDAPTLPLLFGKIQSADYPMPSFLSTSLGSLIRKILVSDPESRASIAEIKTHPWYCYEETTSIGSNNRKSVPLIHDHRDEFYDIDRLGNHINSAHWKNCSSGELQFKRQLHFATHGKIGDVIITIRKHLEAMGFSPDDEHTHNKIKMSRHSPRGVIGLAVTVLLGKGDVLYVEIRRGKGDILEYNTILDELIKKKIHNLIERMLLPPLLSGQEETGYLT